MERVTGIDQVRLRYLLGLIAVTFFALPALFAGWWDGGESRWYWIDLGSYYPTQLLNLLFVLVAGLVVRLDFRTLFGGWPTPRHWRLLLQVDLLLYGMASALVYAIYLPLSYLSPDYVSWWLDWAFMPVIYLEEDGSLPLLANGLNLISLVVLAPLTEELLFRGYLLHRWAAHWGMASAIIVSSTLFGVLHPDPVGAALFGAGMCLLYLHTRALWVPILAHALYNGVIWCWALYDALELGLDYYQYDLHSFRSEWWFGVAGAVLALLMAALFLRGKPNSAVGADDGL